MGFHGVIDWKSLNLIIYIKSKKVYGNLLNHLQSQLLMVLRFLVMSVEFQQAQMSTGAAEAFRVRFQQVLTACWNWVVALLQAIIERDKLIYNNFKRE